MAGVGVVAKAAGAGLGEENLTDEELGMQVFRQEERWRWPWCCAQVEEEASAGPHTPLRTCRQNRANFLSTSRRL
jgi:hypothetical protein